MQRLGCFRQGDSGILAALQVQRLGCFRQGDSGILAAPIVQGLGCIRQGDSGILASPIAQKPDAEINKKGNRPRCRKAGCKTEDKAGRENKFKKIRKQEYID